MRWLIRAVCLVVLAGFFCGCGTGSDIDGDGKKKATLPPEGAESLYLLPQPCDKLYVEVNSIEGVTVKQQWLDKLKGFLQEHCDKPGGITIVREKPIPLSEAKGMAPDHLSTLHMHGPPDDAKEERTSYIYVLFYDSSRMGLKKTHNPHMKYYYPCSIYFDKAYWRFLTDHCIGEILQHEAGHVLGLCSNTDHGDGCHCRNDSCLMRPRIEISWFWWLGGKPANTTLCDDCRKDLLAAKKKGADPRLRFSGPFLVRQEKEYDVVYSPSFVVLSFRQGKGRGMGWREFLKLNRELIAKYKIKDKGSCYVCFLKKPEGEQEAVRIQRAILQVESDSSLHVQETAKRARKNLRKLVPNLVWPGDTIADTQPASAPATQPTP